MFAAEQARLFGSTEGVGDLDSDGFPDVALPPMEGTALLI